MPMVGLRGVQIVTQMAHSLWQSAELCCIRKLRTEPMSASRSDPRSRSGGGIQTTRDDCVQYSLRTQDEMPWTESS